MVFVIVIGTLTYGIVIMIGTLTYGIGNSNRDTYIWYR